MSRESLRFSLDGRSDPERRAAVAASLRGCSALWAAPDVGALVAAATQLIQQLLPDAVVACCERSSAAYGRGGDRAGDARLRIPLTGQRILVVTGTEVDATDAAWVAVAGLIEARARALAESAIVEDSMEQLARSRRLQAALFHIAELAATAVSMDDFYATVYRVVSELLYARNFYIALLSDDGGALTFPYWVDEHSRRGAPRKLGRGLTEYVLRKACPVLVNEQELAHLNATGEVERAYGGAVHWLGVPLVCDAHTSGVLAVQSYDPKSRYSRRDQDLLTFVSYHIANALARVRAKEALRTTLATLEDGVRERTRELSLANQRLRMEIERRKRVEVRLTHDALHDSLTGLPNRACFLRLLGKAYARYHEDRAGGFAVLFVDLDRFKVVNDSEGHTVGDDLLVQAGARLRACLKEQDVVARLGGDEFGVLLNGIADASHAGAIATRVIEDLKAPFGINGKELFTSASVGISLAAGHYRKPGELLRDADSAMYRAKAEGRNRYAVFDDDLRAAAVALLQTQTELQLGLQRGEFVPYYQPVIDVQEHRIAGYEALMRWNHPQRGVLLPGAFLNVAEDTGAVEAMDWQLFAQVCRDANALAGNADLYVAVNLSLRHFSDPRFEQRLLDLLSTYEVPASRLRIEVNERALLERTVGTTQALRTLRAAGIGICLDDFGTGYSSLAFLGQYPIQVLKIDRSLIAAAADGPKAALLRAVLATAEALSLQVIVEGVETPAQRNLLRQPGCRYLQGFLYADAKPAAAWLGEDAAAAVFAHAQDCDRRAMRS